MTILNPLKPARTRHIDLRYKWIIQRTSRGDFKVELVRTGEMIADGLTKALTREKHTAFVKQLGLCVPKDGN
jgi:hypothetical protein